GPGPGEPCCRTGGRPVVEFRVVQGGCICKYQGEAGGEAMKQPSRQPSIATTLSWMNVVASGIALMLVYASVLAYNLFAIREAAVESLTGEAQIVGTNSISAIVFD